MVDSTLSQQRYGRSSRPFATERNVKTSRSESMNITIVAVILRRIVEMVLTKRRVNCAVMTAISGPGGRPMNAEAGSKKLTLLPRTPSSETGSGIHE